MSEYQLPDGREPIRFDSGRAAFYPKKRGDGEVRYLFSMIRHIQNNRQRLTPEQRSADARRRAAEQKQKDPEFFSKIGRKGGQKGKKK